MTASSSSSKFENIISSEGMRGIADLMKALKSDRENSSKRRLDPWIHLILEPSCFHKRRNCRSAENALSRICEREAESPLVHPEIASREIAPLENPLLPRPAPSEMLARCGSRGQTARNFQITKLLDDGLFQVTPFTGEVITRSCGANERRATSSTASFLIEWCHSCSARCHLIF